MSIENLNTAVRAAGFAMAPSDEPTSESNPAKQPGNEDWRPGEPILLTQDEFALGAGDKTATLAGRLRGMLGLFGRGAPA